MEKIDLFLRQIKECTEEEFERKFLVFIEQVENKNKFINDLIHYFNDCRRLLESQKENASEDTVSIIEKEKSRYKRFIYYIKSQYKHSMVKNHYIDTSFSKKSNKRSAPVSHDLVDLTKDLMNKQDVLVYLSDNNLKLEEIIKVLSILDCKKSAFVKRKKKAVKKKNNTYIRQLTVILSSYEIVIGNIEQYIYQLIFPNLENIPVLDDPSFIQQLKVVDNRVAEISNIINFYQQFIRKEKEKYSFLYEKADVFEYLEKRNCQTELLGDYLSKLKEFKEKIHLLERELDYYINKIKKMKIASCVEFKDEMEISIEHEKIKDYILQGKDLSGFELVDCLYALADCIKNKIIFNDLLQYIKMITAEITSEQLYDEKVIEAIYFILDAVKYRLARTDKEKKEVRKILREIRTSFHYVVKCCQNDSKRVKHDYSFDLVNYFLQEENYYLYLKKIVEVMPNIVNTRYLNKDTYTSEHIVLYIVDQFIKNYKIMLYNCQDEYLNKDYLKSVYFLFTRCYMLHLTSEEKEQIDQKFANFMNEVNRNITSSKRKYAVKADLREMYTTNFYLNYCKKRFYDIDVCDLDNHLNSFYGVVKDAKQIEKNYVDCTKENTFTLGNGYHAYSIKKSNKGIIFKIHVIDLYHLIPSHSYLACYLFNQTITSSPIDHIITSQINMARGELYPTITYEMEFDEKGNYCNEKQEVENFRIYPSKIKIDQKYSDYDLIYSNEEEELKLCLDLYRRSFIFYNGDDHDQYFLKDVENYFEKILEKGVIEYFKDRQLPFIYSGVKRISLEEVSDIMNNIVYILSRLDKKEVDQIYKGLGGNIDSFHYSTVDFHGEYQLAIQNPLSYPGLLIQKVLFELVLNNKYSDDEYERVIQKFQREFDDVIASLNNHLGYIDVDILSDNKGKLFQKRKMYF